MLRSLYSGVSGMRAHQSRMDVIGNNIANVNTIGYKSSRVNFTDMLYQTTGNQSSQVGLGVKVGRIDTMFSQAAFESTERPTDFALNGEGFFALKTEAGKFVYTRDGNFSITKEGFLIHTATDIEVQGFEWDPADPADPASVAGIKDQNTDGEFDLTDLRSIKMLDPTSASNPSGEPYDLLTFAVDDQGVIKGLFEDENGYPVEKVIGKLGVVSFNYQEGLKKLGDNLMEQSTSSGGAKLNLGGIGDAKVVEGYLEMSNVELTKEFANMIITQRGYQANSRSITTSDTMLEELLNLKR